MDAKNSEPQRLSLDWLEKVFHEPPRREVMGRSRPTQRFLFKSGATRAEVTCEGGNELTAALLLEQLWRWKYVRRYKLQPFILSDLGIPSRGVPDLLVELTDGRFVVIEVKSAKFFTAERQTAHETTKTQLKEAGLDLRLWTDEKLLGARVWQNVRRLNRASKCELTETDLTTLQAALVDARTIQDLYMRGLSWDSIFCAAGRGLFFINIGELQNAQALISCHCPTKSFQPYFGDRPIVSSWWDRFPDH